MTTLGFYLAGVVCLPSPAAFQIHFQVNTAWPATNLRPTGVVTAVADNGKSKLQPGSGMFTVTTGKLAANIFFFFSPALSKRKTLLVINFILMNYMLNPLPCAVVCDLVYSDGYKGTKKRDILK